MDWWPPGGAGALTDNVVRLLELSRDKGDGPAQAAQAANVVGVSMGGGIAQSGAVRRPDLVASLVLRPDR